MRVLCQKLETRERLTSADKVDHIVIERQGLPRMIISEHVGKLSIYLGDKVIYSEEKPDKTVGGSATPVLGERT